MHTIYWVSISEKQEKLKSEAIICLYWRQSLFTEKWMKVRPLFLPFSTNKQTHTTLTRAWPIFTQHMVWVGKVWETPLPSIYRLWADIQGSVTDWIGTKKHRKISAHADGGPRSRVCARETLRSAPHRHERKFSGTRFCSHLQNFRKKTKKN